MNGNNWKDGEIIANGRVRVWNPSHPRSDSKGYVLRHLLIAEKAMGNPIPRGVEVHHFDNNKRNDSGENLVICQDRTYHALLHQRAKALAVCGHVNWLKCPFCKKYDDPANLHSISHYHNICVNKYNTARKVGLYEHFEEGK